MLCTHNKVQTTQ